MPLPFAIRLILPALFFGYAVLGGLQALHGSQIPLPDKALLSGGLTAGFERLYKRDLPHHSLAFGLIGATRYTLLNEAQAGAIPGRDGWLFTAEETRPRPPSLTPILHSLLHIKARLAARGVDLVLLPLPAKIDLAASHSPSPALSQRAATLHRDFMAALAAAGIPAIDLRPALSGPPAAFFKTDTHWTPEGATLAARAVAASGLIPGGEVRFTTLPLPSRGHSGDLIAFVTTPALAPAIGLPPEPLTATRLDMLGTSDIFAASATDIVLIGTSYSANPDWGFADALMLSLGRDVLNLAEPGLGPMLPMLRYLDSDALATDPPGMVIWEFPVRALTDPALLTSPTPDLVAQTNAGGPHG